jgi:SanA protein
MKKKIFRFALLLTFLVSAATITANLVVARSAKPRLYADAGTIPHHKAGLLLGTNKVLKNGWVNLYFRYRIEAAVALYKAGKIDYIIVSGDNGRDNYNEPQDMIDELVRNGIPANRIYPDYAGFRTLDSVVRCKEIFGQDSITIISQQFHNERALYLAQKNGIYAIGFNARDVAAYGGFKTKLREVFARVKLFVDLFTGKQPRYLGEKVILP